MSANFSGGTSDPAEENSVGTEFSACKTGMDRMNVTSVMLYKTALFC